MKTNIDLLKLLDSIGDAIIVVNAYEKIILWNTAATRIFGFLEEEALGQTLAIITPERHQQRHAAGFSQSMKTGTTRYGSSVLRVPAKHQDGHMLSIAFTVGMLFDEHNQACGVAAVIRDETERFTEEKALKKRLADLKRQAF